MRKHIYWKSMCYVQLIKKKVSPAKSKSITWVEFLLVCFMVFSATFNNITEDPKKTTDLSQVTDKIYHIMLYTSPSSGFELATSVVKDTDCVGSCKSNYYTITATTAAVEFWSERGSLSQCVNTYTESQCAMWK
jgi:hypothetical protein